MKVKTLIGSVLLVLLTACGVKTPDQPIVILYENDVHCAVEGYARFAALRADMLARTPYVTVVSAGDFVQGSTVGSLSQGEYIVDIMNTVPYDVVTVGNHEFDYGVAQMQHLMERLTADVVCCNISKDGQYLFPAYAMRRYGEVQVAFVGIATPTTFTSSTPTYFQDSLGNVCYSFHREDTYDLIQQAVDAARREGADYVIALSHLGDDSECDRSTDMIAATRGIDAVLDGHSHHVFNERRVNACGDSVLFTSTGTAFQYMGRLTIDTSGRLAAELLPCADYAHADSVVVSKVEEVEQSLSELTLQVVGHTDFPLTILGADGKRLVRKGETNLADYLADAIRYNTGADIAFANGGGLRTTIPAGDITYGTLYAVWPFNNTLRTLRGSGQQILDALEVGVKKYPEEDGDFLQVSGLRYGFDPSVASSVVLDENGLFDHVEGARRVTYAEVERDGQWEPLHPDSMYIIGGQSYIMVNQGAAGMFRRMCEVTCPMPNDIDALIQYLRTTDGEVPARYRAAQGRIEVVNR